MSYRLMNPLLNAVFNHPNPTSKHRDLVQTLANHSGAYTIIVPETFRLLSSVDSKTSLPMRDLCLQDDFIASHIVQVPTSSHSQRARYFSTLNGKSVVIDDGKVKVLKGLQAQILASISREYLFSPGTKGFPSNAQFLILEVARPLTGTPIPNKEVSATISGNYDLLSAHTGMKQSGNSKKISADEKEKLDLHVLMSWYPALRRHIQQPLQLVLENFNVSSAQNEDVIGDAFDIAVNLSAQIFQNSDASVISSVTADCDLDGDDIAGFLHDHIDVGVCKRIWGKLIELRRHKDLELMEAIEKIQHVDIAHVGLPEAIPQTELSKLESLVQDAAKELDEISNSLGAKNKMKRLLNVMKILSGNTDTSALIGAARQHVNADYLVSLLTLVICRSHVEHLDTELYYIKNFSFNDTESGQVGYALLTFEGVLFHIANEGAALQKASERNIELWTAIKDKTNINANVKKLLEGDHGSTLLSRRNGESCLMQAIHEQNNEAFFALLKQKDIINTEVILADRSVGGCTLLIAAVQLEQKEIIEAVLDAISNSEDKDKRDYFSCVDEFHRTVGHYLFHAPWLVERVGPLVNWTQRDHNGQTPLFGICRCYDHPKYDQLVSAAISAAKHEAQLAGKELSLYEHIDDKGNTLLHIVKTKETISTILAMIPDINYPNYKKMTPMMIYCKYSRLDAIELLKHHPLLDVDRRDVRSFRAIELARDAEVVSILDNYYLFDQIPINDRVVAITRVAKLDGELQFIIKSSTIGNSSISTVQRSFSDFVFLQKWLTYEKPYSWIPTLKSNQSTSAINRPFRESIYEVQCRLNVFLRILVQHPAFSTHELLWEFLLIQEFSKTQSRDRCRKKLENEKERQYGDSVLYKKADIDPIRTFFEHAGSETRKVSNALGRLSDVSLQLKNKTYDLSNALLIFDGKFAEVEFLRDLHDKCFRNYFTLASEVHSDGNATLSNTLSELSAVSNSVMAALAQPVSLIRQHSQQEFMIEKNQQQLEKLQGKNGWPMGLFEEKREREMHDAQDKIYVGQSEVRKLSSEIKYAHIVSASELGGFYTTQEYEITSLLGKFARTMIRDGKERLMRLERLKSQLSDEL